MSGIKKSEIFVYASTSLNIPVEGRKLLVQLAWEWFNNLKLLRSINIDRKF